MKEEQKLLLILGSHAHVPSGAPEKEFEYAYTHIMRPFVSNLYKYPNIQAVLHYSGVLLYWVERNHPEFFMLIEDMITRKQAEIIGGGFYEPMFPIIPYQDRIGQIELLTTYLRKHFGKRPQGAWIPAMAWEQNMAVSLSSSDMQYTFLSQQQFALAGMNDSELFFPCITEDQGKLVTVFPVCKTIEKELENKSFSEVFVDLKSKIEEKNDKYGQDIIVCVFPEKINSDSNEASDTAWNRFLEEISLSENIAQTTLPLKVLKSVKTLNKASFPNSSAISIVSAIKSADTNTIDDIKMSSISHYSPRRFLIDNRKANGIYSKMVFTSVLINQLKGDKSRKQNAREELWKAQDSCLFLPATQHFNHRLNKAAYSSLLRAEQLSREKGKFISSLVQYDFDFDGRKEYLIQDAILNCYVQLQGACLFELDYLPKEWNYIDCEHTAFRDILLSQDTKITDLQNGFPKDSARLCYNEQYDALSQDRKGKSCFKIISGSIEIFKCFLLKKDILTVSYQLKNTGKEKCGFCFVPEIDFSFADEGEEFVRFYTVEDSKDTHIESRAAIASAQTLKILDVANEVQIVLNSSNAFSGSLIPGAVTRILPLFNIELEAGKSWTNEFSLKFSH